MSTPLPLLEQAEPVEHREHALGARVTILTPTIPGREALLAEAAASVAAQTTRCYHLSLLDANGDGPAWTRNRLLGLVQTEYVGFLDDDDLLLPRHVEALMPFLDWADLAWSHCRTVFGEGVAPIQVFQPLRPDYTQIIGGGRNFIPVTVLARTESIRSAGGFDPADRFEDYELWRRMLNASMRFAHLPETTWVYRFLGANRTYARRAP